jgi:hypothetical protein
MELISNHGNWDELKKKLRKKYPQLTESDLQNKEGMEVIMLRIIAYKLRKTKQEMKEIIAGIGYSISDTYLYIKERKMK